MLVFFLFFRFAKAVTSIIFVASAIVSDCDCTCSNSCRLLGIGHPLQCIGGGLANTWIRMPQQRHHTLQGSIMLGLRHACKGLDSSTSHPFVRTFQALSDVIDCSAPAQCYSSHHLPCFQPHVL